MFDELRERLVILKNRKNLSSLSIIKFVLMRTGFYKIYESVDRLELLELHNNKLKTKMRQIRENSFHINEKVDHTD